MKMKQQMNVNNKQLFSELNGFVIYNEFLLKKYLTENNLLDNDILMYFTETDHGDTITKEGIAIPIFDLPADYYQFKIINDENNIKAPLTKSTGWIFNSYSGNFKVVGIGYLKNITMINDNNSLTFIISEGWKKLNIISYYDDLTNAPSFGLNFINSLEKPIFNGDFNINFNFD